MKYFEIWKPGKAVSYAITITCDLGFILFGIEQGILGIVITGEDFLNQFNNPQGSFLGFVVLIYTLGCFFGCIVNYYLGNWLGRRRTIACAMGAIIIGVTLQTTAFHVAHLMVGRFITGLGTGMETSCVPMYQSELAHHKNRGNKVASEALFVGVGLVYAYFLDFGLSYVNGPVAWRLPIATQILFALSVLGMTLTVPESPRYLFLQGNKKEAKRILSYVFNKDEDHPEIVKAYKEIEEAVALETIEGDYSWKRLVRDDQARTRNRVILAYLAMFAQQVGGINLINYYITTVLEVNVGLEHTLAMILGGVSVICFTVGSFVPSFFADRLGRRLPMVYGSLGCGFCFLMIAVLLSVQHDDALRARCSSAAVGFFLLYQLIFGATANCLPWAIVPEVLPLHARSRGTAIGISSNWIWNFVIVEITPVIILHLKWKGYLIFMCTNFAFAPMFYYFFPETKGLSLEAIDRLFSENRTIFMGLVDPKKVLNDDFVQSEQIESKTESDIKYAIDHVESA